jgi:hypothetical protein
MPNNAIVDCTASDAPAQHYLQWMEQGIHIITPNKKLGSGPLQQYQAVRRMQRESMVHFFYEGTVGAGLPVIGTLKHLLETGAPPRAWGPPHLAQGCCCCWRRLWPPAGGAAGEEQLGLQRAPIHHRRRHHHRHHHHPTPPAHPPPTPPPHTLPPAGDKIIKIEGIFSGTLSYIFNTFGDGRAFSAIVQDAKEKGYTEPDPRCARAGGWLAGWAERGGCGGAAGGGGRGCWGCGWC